MVLICFGTIILKEYKINMSLFWDLEAFYYRMVFITMALRLVASDF